MSDAIRDSIWQTAVSCVFPACVFFETMEMEDRYGPKHSSSYDQDQKDLYDAIDHHLHVTGEDILEHNLTVEQLLDRPRTDDDQVLERAGRSSGYGTFDEEDDDVPGTKFKNSLLVLIYETARAQEFYPAEDFENMCLREVAPAHLDEHMIPDLAGMVLGYM